MKPPKEIPSEEEFRKTGCTKNAAYYPLSEAALRHKAAANGIAPELAPPTWWYAPNQYFQDYWEGRREV